MEEDKNLEKIKCDRCGDKQHLDYNLDGHLVCLNCGVGDI